MVDGYRSAEGLRVEEDARVGDWREGWRKMLPAVERVDLRELGWVEHFEYEYSGRRFVEGERLEDPLRRKRSPIPFSARA